MSGSARAAAAKNSRTWMGFAIPVVSPKPTSTAPASAIRPATSSTRSTGTWPSYGHPNEVEITASQRKPSDSARANVRSSPAIESATERPTFFWLCVSDADRNPLISWKRSRWRSARSSPRSFGIRTLTDTVSGRSTPARTSSASASCGITSGRTKLVTSSRRRPVAPSISISRTLPAVPMISGSFWNPSRGPTSRTRTAAGSSLIPLLIDEAQSEQVRDGLETVALALEGLDLQWQRRERFRSVAAAVVLEDDRAVVGVGDHVLVDRVHARQRPVTRIDVPLGHDESQPVGERDQLWRCGSVRRPEQAGLKAAGGGPDRSRRRRDLAGGGVVARAHVGVIPGVVSDHVAVGQHPALDRAVVPVDADPLADLEERGHHVLALEDVEELRGVRRRAVVERQRHHALIARALVDHPLTRRHAAHELRDVQRGQAAAQREVPSARDVVTARSQTGRADEAAEHPPMHWRVVEPDRTGEKRGGQLSRAAARH